jgi:hypothetical protein
LAEHANSEHRAQIEEVWSFDPKRNMYYPAKKAGVKPREESQCAFCPLVFLSMSVLYQHANTVHKEEVQKQWFLDTTRGCYYPVPEEQRRKKFSNGGVIVKCEFCSKSLKNNFVYHANRFHHEVIANAWPGHCAECNMFFPSISSYRSHNLAKHKITYSYSRYLRSTMGELKGEVENNSCLS